MTLSRLALNLLYCSALLRGMPKFEICGWKHSWAEFPPGLCSSLVLQNRLPPALQGEAVNLHVLHEPPQTVSPLMSTVQHLCVTLGHWVISIPG